MDYRAFVEHTAKDIVYRTDHSEIHADYEEWLTAVIEESWQEEYAEHDKEDTATYYAGLYRFRHDVMMELSRYVEGE